MLIPQQTIARRRFLLRNKIHALRMRRGADVSTTDVQQFVKEEERMKDLFRFHIFKSQRGELHLF
jgi:hypothetical protein